MSAHTYRVIEVVGSSSISIDDAISGAVQKAGATTRNLEWYEVVQVRGHIVGDKIGHHQVTLKIGFRLDDQ